jgi:iron complex transport system substrate-binding protein
VRCLALVLLLLVACGAPEQVAPSGELRIISLSPSITEILIALGLRDRLVGVDAWSKLADVPSLGGLFAPDLERALELAPTLVLGVRSEQQGPFFAQLRARGVRAEEIDTSGSFDDVLATYATIGALVGRETEAMQLETRVRREIAAVARSVADRPRTSVALVDEREPLYVAAGGSFATTLVEAAGGRNVFADLPSSYPQVSLELLAERAPEVLIDSTQTSAGAATEAEARAYWTRFAFVKRVELVPPGVATLPGVELAKGAELLRARIHPELAEAAAP